MVNNPSVDLSRALHTELCKNTPDFEIIKKYLADGADINFQSEKEGYTALMFAVEKQDESLVHYLLQQNANSLIQNHHHKIASDLIQKNSPIYHVLKNYELLCATVQNDLEKVKAILTAGADINFKGQGGYSALMIAAEESLIELFEFLMGKGADLSIKGEDGLDIFVTDQVIFTELRCGKVLSAEAKESLFGTEDRDRLEQGRLKTLEERKGQSFSLSHLKIRPSRGQFKPAPTAKQLAELEQHFGHPLPAILKELFAHYNGGIPQLCYHGDDEDNAVTHFYFVDENRDSAGNIWWSIKRHAEFLGTETLPFAGDSYGGVYYLKWLDGNAEVWLFQYGDQPFGYDEDDDDEDEDKMPTAFTRFSHSLEDFLESLYEA